MKFSNGSALRAVVGSIGVSMLLGVVSVGLTSCATGNDKEQGMSGDMNSNSAQDSGKKKKKKHKKHKKAKKKPAASDDE